MHVIERSLIAKNEEVRANKNKRVGTISIVYYVKVFHTLLMIKIHSEV